MTRLAEAPPALPFSLSADELDAVPGTEGAGMCAAYSRMAAWASAAEKGLVDAAVAGVANVDNATTAAPVRATARALKPVNIVPPDAPDPGSEPCGESLATIAGCGLDADWTVMSG